MTHRNAHAQIHLPPLSAEEACLLVTILDRAVIAIWRAHGDAMINFQGRAFPDVAPQHAAVDARELPVFTEDDIPF